MAAPLHLIAIPLLGGLAAGGGALTSYVGASASMPVEITRPADRPCAAQTWPYLDTKCLTQAPKRPVRLVVAPRAEATDAADTVAAPAASPPSAPAPEPDVAVPPGLISSDAILYQSRTPAPAPKPRAKPSERFPQHSARRYQAPSKARPGSPPRIVVRPLRLSDFR